ncbi:transcriptional regulator NrdR [Ursidibacter arcticus]|uniref:transcriptional regulator NrdR n=1 Tax=Ursidibacter arcticus TaxID=1524965 RepID=UPI0012FA31BE|nr:transcriptional regulator NrdR [Ursidibacter arcticus]KAE9536259.1 transcriptional regulator NrdR [Ursidibacter arcticus]
MRCPFCAEDETKVVDSRLTADGYQIRRRRECIQCKERFTTFETAELLVPHIVKNNGNREPFNIQKLRLGLSRALEKRPVSADELEKAINNIVLQLQATGEREISSKYVGNLVLDALKSLDKVAYIRFASVYLSFDDITEFTNEIEKLRLESLN